MVATGRAMNGADGFILRCPQGYDDEVVALPDGWRLLKSRSPPLVIAGSEPVPALDRQRHGVKITPVGVEVLEVDE